MAGFAILIAGMACLIVNIMRAHGGQLPRYGLIMFVAGLGLILVGLALGI